MSRMTRMMAAVSAAALMSAAVTLAVRAQDTAPTPAPAPAAEAPAALTEPPRDPSTVVAKAGSAEVTEGDIALAQEAFAEELGRVPEAQQRSVLVDAVVNLLLMAQGAKDAGLDQGPEFERRLAFLKLQALRNAYVENQVVKNVTDAELQQSYQTLVVAQHKPEQQVHARHILVDTKEQAEKIIEELKGGAKFEDLAKQSKDPSGQNGGDLGFFGPGQMVPPFETAAFALEPGKFTEEPVQTEFGFHVIKVEEKRMSAAADLRRGEGRAAQLRAAAEIRAGHRRRCGTSIRSRSSIRQRCRRRNRRPHRRRAAPAPDGAGPAGDAAPPRTSLLRRPRQ